MDGPARQAAQVALASTLVQSASNLHFGPEVGVKGRRQDAEVVGAWLKRVHVVVADLREAGRQDGFGTAQVFRHDARDIPPEMKPGSVDAVFTSPPYPNEKDYTRTTRLETVVLGFVAGKQDLRALKRQLVRSNTRGVYKEDADAQ